MSYAFSFCRWSFIADIMKICNDSEIRTSSDHWSQRWSCNFIPSYKQLTVVHWKPKCIHVAGFCTHKIYVVFDGYGSWFYFWKDIWLTFGVNNVQFSCVTVKSVLMIMVKLNRKNKNLFLCITFVVRGSQS
jgi:hypothetical protein